MIRVPTLTRWIAANPAAVEALLFDIDGTLLRGHGAHAGAIDLIGRLEQEGVPYLLLTNDANHSHEEKAARLKRAGLTIPPTHIVSAGDVITEAAIEFDLAGTTFFVMGELGTPNYAEQAGIRVTRALGALPECRGVIVGEENYDWEPTFNAVINFFIAHREGLLIVPNPDSYWPDGSGGIAIGAGGTARFICSILDDCGVHVDPLFLGKPFPAAFTFARRELDRIYGCRPTEMRRILMVGDSLTGDIRGANRSGYTSVLVLTGITTEEMLLRGDLAADLLPDLIVDGL